MNLPNKLTVLRVLLIPFFVVALLWEHGESQTMRYVAATIFIVASLTDLLDGKIARKYNLVTNFGKFMDPLADKLLVCSALICLIELQRIPSCRPGRRGGSRRAPWRSLPAWPKRTRRRGRVCAG